MFGVLLPQCESSDEEGGEVMATFDTIIKGGMVVDGRRNPRVKADVGIKDGLVSEIGSIDSRRARRTLDAKGLVVAPGFVDLHTHYDSQLFWDPYCSSSGWHGVTTVVIGNCGYGFAPCRVEERDRAMMTMTRTEAVPFSSMKAGMPWDWVTFPEYIASVSRAPKAINVAVTVPLNPLMVWVMGMDRAKSGQLPTDEEHRELARLFDEAMDAGAIGISAQRLGEGTIQPDFDGTPLPTDLLHDETMLVLADVVRKRNEGVIQYIYSDFAEFFNKPDGSVGTPEQARLHVEDVARRSGRGVIVLPFKVDGALDWMRTCRDRGLSIYPQRLTVTIRKSPCHINIAEGGSIFDGCPAWRRAAVGTIDEIKENLRDQGVRSELRQYLAGWNIEAWVLVDGKAPENVKYERKTLREISADQNNKDYLDTFLDTSIAGDLRSDWTGPPFPGPVNLDSFKKIVSDDYWIPGISDGGAHTKYLSQGHCGTLFLMSYVREHAWISLEDAHYRLSALPAHAAGLEQNLGTLVVGAPADIIVYDFDRLSISEQARLFDYPGNEWRVADRGVGYRWVMVNGEIIIEDDKETGASSGRVVHTARRCNRLPC